MLFEIIDEGIYIDKIKSRIGRDAERSTPEVIDIEIAGLSAINNNMNDELKIVKNHANRNAWRMDCLYCAMMDIKSEVDVQTFYYEFILEQYNKYTEKLMHYACNGELSRNTDLAYTF